MLGDSMELAQAPECPPAPASRRSSGSRRDLRTSFSCRDGRKCKTCGRADTTPDPVFPEEPLFWLYSPTADGKPQGFSFGYCPRVFTGKYSGRYKTRDELVTAMGRDQELALQFNDDLQSCTNKMVQAGTRDIRVKKTRGGSIV